MRLDAFGQVDVRTGEGCAGVQLRIEEPARRAADLFDAILPGRRSQP